MASITSDAGQHKLLQIFTPLSAQTVNISLRDEEALSASGESTDTAIFISDDDDTDTEDEEDDESQDADDSQSCCTTPTKASIADHLDSTGTKQNPIESEAAIGLDTTPAALVVRAEGVLTWTQESHMDRLAIPELNQQSLLQMDHAPAGDTTACVEASFDVSTTSPERQLPLGVLDEQQLVTEATGATSVPGVMMIDAPSDEEACQRAQSTPASPLMRTYSPIAATPQEMAQTLLNDGAVRVSTPRDDATPGARNPSLAARMSPKPHRGQDLDDASCKSSDAESEAADSGSRSPFGARASPQLPSPRRSRRRSTRAHATAQEGNSDADTEGSGSEDGLDVPEYACDGDYCPSPPEVQGSGSEDDDFDDEEHQDRKRRKVSKSLSRSAHNADTSTRDSRLRRRPTRASAHSLRERDTSALGLLGPTSSRARSIPSEASAVLARFQEWPLENVSMKRITENGKTTFQFQFEWPFCTDHRHATSVIPDSTTRSAATRKTTKRAPARREKYSDDEDNFLIKLKEEEKLGWAEIRQRFAQRFPERGGSSLQVHYCTKLKYRRT
ncbi:hypothetical protein ACJA88_014858 [Fusarium oxysporum]